MSAAPEHPDQPLALHGVQAIEASAGTGKTFTLATLVLRLVVERGLRIEQVLAVTFTEAATQELRSRIRARLLLASGLLDTMMAEVAGVADAASSDEPDTGESSETTITRAVLDAHRAGSGESLGSLRNRLRSAIDGIDLAAIYTIHGFCARVLRDHALESGQGFDTPDLLANDRDLREEIAADLWRVGAIETEGANDLLTLWPGGPEAMAADLSALVRERVLMPEAGPLPADPSQPLHEAADRLIAAVREHGEAFRMDVLAAIAGKVLNGQSYKIDWVDGLFDALRQWSGHGDAAVIFQHDRLDRLTVDFLTAKTNKGKDASRPASPLSAVVAEYLVVRDALEAYRAARRVNVLHDVRREARRRLALRKRELRVQTYDDLIDRVAEALDGPQADALVARLREQYRIALVDEFQDTDWRQWQIFRRVFGADSGDPALFLIGDPKQAIYGFRGGDVDTYLAAVEQKSTTKAPPLVHNFRSRPSVLAAVDALYAAAGDDAFVVKDIVFHPVKPGGVCLDRHYLVAESSTSAAKAGLMPAPALTIWRAPAPLPDAAGKVKPWSADQSRALATAACVAQIHRVLTQSRAGQQLIDGRALQPGDMAVLVRSHGEATRIRQALAEAGIPAVAAGKQSLFATDEARDLHALLLALLHGADDTRLRMALATVLVGVDAAGIAALESNGDALHDRRLQALAWREQLDTGGALALVNSLCAQQAQRLLGLHDGERRLTNYLQLGERLQEAQRDTLGLHGLVDWLTRAIAQADGHDDTQLLRLESDARRVQVVTLHKSKGLEYPLVFLPYAGIGGRTRPAGRYVIVNESGERVLHWHLQAEQSGWEPSKAAWQRAEKAEDARLLYVGLTRARHALWLATGDFANHAASALAPMLANPTGLAKAHPDAIILDDTRPSGELPWLTTENESAVPAARVQQRHPAADWWVYSFTQLAHADSQASARADSGQLVMAATTEDVGSAADEPALDPLLQETVGPVDDGHDARFSGSRFGNVLHAALERVDFAAWAHWRDGDSAPADQANVLRSALREEGYGETDLDDGAALLTGLVGRTLTVRLPEGGALHALNPDERRAEIEFHFAMQPTAVPALLDLLHGHGMLRERRGFGLRRQLEGLMTGKIDLTYVHDGRWYVLDYKSNRLPRYDASAMAAAMAHSEYDLQALIYTLALHRWLRFRLGEGYDYARDFGGIRYLFCRGLAPHADSGDGVHAQRFAPELVHALDALFAGRPAATPRVGRDQRDVGESRA